MKKYHWGMGIAILLMGVSLGTAPKSVQAATSTEIQQVIKSGKLANGNSRLDLGDINLGNLIDNSVPVEDFGNELYKVLFVRDSFSISSANSFRSDDLTDAPDYEAMQADHQWYDDNPDTQIITRQSEDGLTLSARYLQNGNSKKTVIVAHGYRGTSKDAAFWAKMYYDMGYNVLAPDARAHGASEGKTITFGWKEKQDYQGWIQQMIETTGQETDIVLQGVSMGAATVMMTGGEQLPDNVKAIVEDAGYTSLSDEIDYLLTELRPFGMFDDDETLEEIQGTERMQVALKIANDKLVQTAGMSIADVSTVNQVQKTTLPTLFIHGGNDTFVPTRMVDTLYDASSSLLKKKVVIPDATHGFSMAYDRATYYQEVTDFLIKTDKLELQTLIEKAKAVKPETDQHFTTSSEKQLQTELTKAQTVLANDQATQDEVDAAIKTLETALDGLVQVNPVALQAEITVAKKVAPKEGYTFTSETAAQLATKLTAAEQVLANLDASQVQVDQATTDLKVAVQGLKQVAIKTKVDTAELTALVNYADQLQNNRYTDASFSAVKSALGQAKVILANPDATQAQIDAAYGQLNQAIQGLVIVEKAAVKPSQPAVNQHKATDTKTKLPRTGENRGQSVLLVLIGSLLVGSTAIVFYRRRRHN